MPTQRLRQSWLVLMRTQGSLLSETRLQNGEYMVLCGCVRVFARAWLRAWLRTWLRTHIRVSMSVGRTSAMRACRSTRRWWYDAAAPVRSACLHLRSPHTAPLASARPHVRTRAGRELLPTLPRLPGARSIPPASSGNILNLTLEPHQRRAKYDVSSSLLGI